jgi:beta-lactamase regulating signal transducer with metallopeptidase domain
MNTSLTALEWALWRATWQASALAALVLVLQTLLGKRLGGHGRYLLWIVVIVRLLLPVAPQSRWSLYNLASGAQTTTTIVAPRVETAETTEFSAKAQAGKSTPTISKLELAATVPVARPIDWRHLAPLLIGATWLCGIIVLSMNVIAACWWLRRVQRSLHAVTDPRILAIVESSRELLSLRYRPHVLRGDSVRTPAVVGVFRPALWLPTQVLARCDDEQIRLIVLHELAHLKRNDVPTNWLIAAATILHWFNPIVWLVAMRMRSDRELACDELVLSISAGRDAQAYGRTLLRLVELLSTPKSIPQPHVVGILESTGPMKRRVRMIARFNPPPPSLGKSSRWIWTFALLLGLGCTTLTDAVHGDDTGKQPQQPQPKAQQVKPAAHAGAAVVDHPQDKAELERLLGQVLTEVKFESMGFSDIIDFLRDQTGANIIVEWRALENAGIDKNTPVTLRMQRAAVDQVLDHLLHDVGGGTVKLDYMIDKGAIVISTDEELGKRVTTVSYDVSDLMMRGPSGESLTGEPLQQHLSQLMKLIQDTIAADSWKDNGGTVGSIMEFNQKFVIQQTPKTHQQIERLLDRLREQPTSQPRPLEP